MCSLPDADVNTVSRMQCSSLKHGLLLAEAQKQSGVFETVEPKLSFRQHRSAFGIAVLVLKAKTNCLLALRSA